MNDASKKNMMSISGMISIRECLRRTGEGSFTRDARTLNSTTGGSRQLEGLVAAKHQKPSSKLQKSSKQAKAPMGTGSKALRSWRSILR